VDIRTFNNRRLLETGPAAVRNTLPATADETMTPSTKKLKGLPNSLVQQYFSTLFYYEKGYMADWIYHAAKDLKVQEINIDILSDRTDPSGLEIRPILYGLSELRQTIKKILTSNKFPPDFIIKASFQIRLTNESGSKRLLKVRGLAEDKFGKVYEGHIYNEYAFEDSFSLQ
jgi:hypothetical protein